MVLDTIFILSELIHYYKARIARWRIIIMFYFAVIVPFWVTVHHQRLKMNIENTNHLAKQLLVLMFYFIVLIKFLTFVYIKYSLSISDDDLWSETSGWYYYEHKILVFLPLYLFYNYMLFLSKFYHRIYRNQVTNLFENL